jgi:formamidopyrimidine-DNA glycosylase
VCSSPRSLRAPRSIVLGQSLLRSCVPELPEVETVRRELETHLLGRHIVQAKLHRLDVLRPRSHLKAFQRWSPAQHAHALLQGTRIIAVRRVGKALGLMCDAGRCMQIHLGMSGQVRFDEAARDASHIHAEWTLDNGQQLVFRDPRRFGGLWPMASEKELEVHWSRLGPDALSIDHAQLSLGVHTSRRSIKAILLDQGVIAGVGNIYADESLFEAQIHPGQPGQSLSNGQLDRLASAIRAILQQAIARGGSTLLDYRTPSGLAGEAQSVHRVYGRSGLPCTRCGAVIESAPLAGRTTCWCETCQPIKRTP